MSETMNQQQETPYNPYAFPMSIRQGDEWQEGMSLRDYFAGQAISGILSGCGESGHNETPSKYVETAYAIADLMLKEREK